MMYYSEQCKDAWIKTDVNAINAAIKIANESQILTRTEFECIVCPSCPYMCNNATFCWYNYNTFKYVDNRQNYKDIIKELITGFYNETRVNTFSFFRNKICRACGAGCERVYLSSICPEKYLDQLKDVNSTKKYGCFSQVALPNKKLMFPLMSINGTKMSEIVNRLWNDKILVNIS